MLYKIFYIEALTQIFLPIKLSLPKWFTTRSTNNGFKKFQKTQRAKPSEISCFKTISKWIKKRIIYISM